MKDPNLGYLENRWLKGSSADKAVEHFSKSADLKLWHLLRHHEQEGITEGETWLRDAYDYLLGFYGVVEIASMIGFVPALPAEFVSTHLRILTHPAVRQYYEWNYPQDLPRRLRERILYRIEYAIDTNERTVPLFYEFLELIACLEQDSPMESFLWALDDGTREDKEGEVDIEVIRSALKSPHQLFGALQTGKKTEKQNALVGFSNFIDFCESFSALLCRVDNPQLAEAMWLYPAYWFRQFKSSIGDEMKATVRALVTWNVPKSDVALVRQRVSHLEKLVDNLAIPPTVNLVTAKPSVHKSESKSAEVVSAAPSSVVKVEEIKPGEIIDFKGKTYLHIPQTELARLAKALRGQKRITGVKSQQFTFPTKKLIKSSGKVLLPAKPKNPAKKK